MLWGHQMKCRKKTNLELTEEISILKQRVRELEQSSLALLQAEEELKANRRQLSNALEIAHLGHWEYDVVSDLFTFNDQFYKIFHTTVENVGGYTMRSAEYALRFIHPDDMAMLAEEIREAMETTDPYFTRQIEHRMLYADGTVGHIVIRHFVVKDAHGRTVKTYGVNQDITELKKLEERLLRSEKMEALGMLAGGVAHDLNNVLGIVVGFSELLLRTNIEPSSVKPQLENIKRGGQRAAAIVEDLLTLARRGVASRQVLNLNKIISDLQQSPELGKLCEHHPRVEIKTDLAQPPLNISGSSIHLSKSLFNLVSNASEAMPQGGILTIKTANQYLDKPIKGYDEVREGDYVVLSVSDTGEGILAADLKHIFEPFYTKKVMGRSGTGLGLSVVWGTVKDHQGYIDIQSEEGKGTTFTLYFPITRQEIDAPATIRAISEYMGNGESILVVDDVKEQRDLAVSMLGMLNYIVSSVPGGEDAIAFVKQHPVDLIVLDMIMEPGMDGLDTYKKIVDVNPGQKAIIVSGYAETDRVTQAQELGAGPFVKKPYVLENIGLAVRKHLDS